MNVSRFSYRIFTSFLLAWSFSALVFSGVILYISPAGRVAHWTNWTLMGLSKEGWQGVHFLVALVFLVGGLFHLLKFNWKVFLHYLRTRSGGFNYAREASLSVFVVVLILGGMASGLPPFAMVADVSESVKAYWETESSTAPIPHMELLSLAEVSRQLQVSPGDAWIHLRDAGLVADGPEAPLGEIGEANGLSPRDVYSVLSQIKSAKPPDGLRISGLGRKSVLEVEEELGLSAGTLLKALQSRGQVVSPDETIKEIATRMQMDPHDLLAEITAD
ncbi:MAG: DUF4405 domain-containing protein [Acidobacteriota bacterium]|nr:MAG: DUF4405 domain-containing protein [Acidobacteriota bacterium]